MRRRMATLPTIIRTSNRSPEDVIAGMATLMKMAAVLLLFAAFVSGFDVVTVAVFWTLPGVGGSVSTSEIVADPPLATVPRAQVTVVVPLQLP